MFIETFLCVTNELLMTHGLSSEITRYGLFSLSVGLENGQPATFETT